MSLPGFTPPQPATALLELQLLNFSYPGSDRPVFERLSARLPAGLGWICGDEGRGKTTLLRLLAGGLTAVQGRILFNGLVLKADQVAWFDPPTQIQWRQQEVVRDILAELVPRPPADWADLLVELGLEPHLDKPLYQLSTGSRRKVFLAATLAQDLPVMLLDQPFVALDQPSIDALIDRFRAWTPQSARLLVVADYLPAKDLPSNFILDLDRGP